MQSIQGRGRSHALKNQTEVSLSKKENKAYIFIATGLSRNSEDKYPFELKQKYTITETIGSGAFGEVKLAFEKYTTNKFAVKIIQKKKMTMNVKLMKINLLI